MMTDLHIFTGDRSRSFLQCNTNAHCTAKMLVVVLSPTLYLVESSRNDENHKKNHKRKPDITFLLISSVKNWDLPKMTARDFVFVGCFFIIYLLVGCLILMINQSVFIAAIEPSVIFLLCSIVNNWALPKKWAREYCGCRVSRIIYLGDLSHRETLMRTNDFARMNSAVPRGLTRFQDF